MMEQDLPHILERRNSDNENQNPNPIIQTRKLSEYKVILVPRQIKPPTRREIRDAGRCRRAGMVPGAIRKYLLQKKKHEITDAEDEEEEDQDLDPVSDEDAEVNEDADAEGDDEEARDPAELDVDVDVAAAERHRRCQGHCCEAKTKRTDPGQGEGCPMEEEDDDEVSIVGEFRTHPVLGEVNSDRGAQVNGSATASAHDSRSRSRSPDSGQDDFCPEDEDEEKEPESNNNNSTNKRRHSEAFTASPDTTTPDVTSTSAGAATPTPSTSRVRSLEIESSPVVLQYESSPAAKRSRLETTPKVKPVNRVNKRGGSTSSVSTAGGTSSDNEPRTGPSRKSRKVRVSGIELESPTDKQSWVRNIFQQDGVTTGPRCTQTPEDPELEKKVRKNVWKDVIHTFETNLDKDLVPSPSHVGDLIKKAILGLGTRVARDIPATALEFFGKLVQKYPVSGGVEITEYYSSAFTQTTSSDPCTMTEFLFDVLGQVQGDAQARVQSKPLPFFKLLTRMVVQQYKDYAASQVKVRRPFFVQFLEDPQPLRIFSYNFYCKKLVHFTFLLKNYQEEFKSVMRWVGLLSYHLKKHSRLDDEFRALVDDFVGTLAKPEHSSSTCEVVEAICDPSLGLAVSFKIICNRIQFESARNSDEKPLDSEIAEYLQTLAKSDSISGLKSELQERRHSHSTEAYPTLPISSLVTATVNKAGRRNKPAETPAVNLKGESYLHKLCKKEQSQAQAQPQPGTSAGSGGSNSNSSSLKLADLLRQKQFSTVNPTDNFGNTPLHDAIAHGRFDAVTKFYEFCSNVDLPEELRVNVLAQNKAGDTPFHLAAISPDQSEQMSKVLVFMADKLQVKEEALKIQNHQGKMPFELAFNSATRSLLKPHALEEWNFQLGDVYVNPSRRAQLQSLETKKLILFWSNCSQQDE